MGLFQWIQWMVYIFISIVRDFWVFDNEFATWHCLYWYPLYLERYLLFLFNLFLFSLWRLYYDSQWIILITKFLLNYMLNIYFSHRIKNSGYCLNTYLNKLNCRKIRHYKNMMGQCAFVIYIVTVFWLWHKFSFLFFS